MNTSESNSTDSECTAQRRVIKHVQPHPCYCDSDSILCGSKVFPFPGSYVTRLQFDAALITVDRPFRFNQFVQPVCLPAKEHELPGGTMVTVSGFGRLKYQGNIPDSLQYVTIPVVENEECNSFFERNDTKVYDDMLCAGYKSGNEGSCNGDSGGPLVFFNQSTDVRQSQAVLYGIVSWGFYCNHLSVYSKVSNFVEWVHEAVEKSINGNVELPTAPEYWYVEFENDRCQKYLNFSRITTTTEAMTKTTTVQADDIETVTSICDEEHFIAGICSSATSPWFSWYGALIFPLFVMFCHAPGH